MAAVRVGQARTGEKILSTSVPVIGDGSTLRRSVYAKASAEPASSASASAGGIQRLLTTRRFYGGGRDRGQPPRRARHHRLYTFRK